MALSQLGAMSLLAKKVTKSQQTEVNSLFNLGTFIPAGIFSASSGFLIDFFGLSVAIDILTCIVASIALLSFIYVLRNVYEL